MNTSYPLHACFVQGTVLTASHMLNHLILTTPYEVGASIVVLQLGETETLRRVRKCASSHTLISGRAGI